MKAIWLGGFLRPVLVWRRGLMVCAGYRCKWPSITLHSKSDRPPPITITLRSPRPRARPRTHTNPIKVIRNYGMPLKVCRRQLSKPYISHSENIITGQDYRFLIPALCWWMGGGEQLYSLCVVFSPAVVTDVCLPSPPVGLIDRHRLLSSVGMQPTDGFLLKLTLINRDEVLLNVTWEYSWHWDSWPLKSISSSNQYIYL